MTDDERMDDYIVGRKAIIALLKKPLDLSGDGKVAWNKIMKWRKEYGMEKLFYRNMAGRPFVMASEIREWLISTRDVAQRVRRGFEKRDREIVPEKQ